MGGGQEGGWSEQRNRLCRARTPSGGQSKDLEEKQCCITARKGRHGMVEIEILCFRWLTPFVKCVQKGLPGYA